MRTIAMAGRSELRRRWVGALAIGVAAALGLGAALGAFIAAYRTDRAYPDHVARARIADLVVNPSLSSIDSDRVDYVTHDKCQRSQWHHKLLLQRRGYRSREHCFPG